MKEECARKIKKKGKIEVNRKKVKKKNENERRKDKSASLNYLSLSDWLIDVKEERSE